MADPRNELADIVVPAAPAMAPPAGGSLWPWAVAGLACVAGAVWFAWLWRRRTPARALRAIAVAAAGRQGAVPEQAARLDAWARRTFRLARVDAAGCPPGLDPAQWRDWADALARLRFAPPPPDGYTVLASLCESARGWRRHA